GGEVVRGGEVVAEGGKRVVVGVGWVAGGLDEAEYRGKLSAAGFENVDVEPTRIYRAADAREFLATEGIDADTIAPQVDGKFMSAFVRAVKPTVKQSCCGPTCCN